MSLEEHLDKGLFCHRWLNVGKPGIELVGLLLPMFAKVCKIWQLPTLEFDVSPYWTSLSMPSGYTVTLSQVRGLSVMPDVVLRSRGCPKVSMTSRFLSNRSLSIKPATKMAVQTPTAASRVKISRMVMTGFATSGPGPNSDRWSSLVASTVRL